MAKQKITVEICDNPRCKKGDGQRPYSEEIFPEDPSTMGYHLGKGHWVLGGGGPIPATYACSKECIVPAIEAQIDRDMGRDPLTGDYL
ncbi:hypothetical protein SEA_RASPUTIA_100 [Microbacterium phage Rasputia]|nr:hypothetical protein SEA_RASPUTIA_100 [Microbacterium phage Rasputia]